MKCRKCGKEIFQESKFCNFCGIKIELSITEINEHIANCSKRIFFIFGLLHGISSMQPEAEKLKKIYEEVKNHSEFSKEIHEVIDYWNNEIFNKQGKK